MGSSSEIIISLWDFNGHVGKCAEGFKSVQGGIVLGKEMQKKEGCWSSVMKESCTWQTLGFNKTDKRKITYSAGGCETKIDFVLV